MMFYAVKKGHTVGIFDNWPECQAATKGFSGSQFMKFNTRAEAEAYLEDRDVWAEQVAVDNSNGYLVAFTDGSFEKNLKRYSYGVVFARPDGTETNICGYGSNDLYIESNNIIGEIFGVINALDWAISNSFDRVKIYHDYEGLPKWLSGEWSAKTAASKMFVSLFKAKFEGVLEVVFAKVPGHSNVSYNEKADQLAKAALIERKRVPVQGQHWYSIPYFSKPDFDAFAELIVESDASITYTTVDTAEKSIYRFKMNADSVTVTLFKSGKHKLLVQGKNTYLFQVIASTIIELDETSNVEQIIGNAYRISIKSEVVDDAYGMIESGLPSAYPTGIKRLIKQSVINLKYHIVSEDYSQYAVPALRALEGHIKYLITISGGTVGRNFDGFNKNPGSGTYYYAAALLDNSRKAAIEACYNYYKSQRDTLSHFGDIFGAVDNTRFINTKEESDEIILKCLDLINTQL